MIEPLDETIYGDETIQRFCIRLGCSRDEAFDFLAVADDLGILRDSERVEVDALNQLNAKFRKATQLLVTYQQNQKRKHEVIMSTRAMCLALGYTRSAGADSIKTLSRHVGLSKQTVGKCVNLFIDQLDMSKLTGQRGEEMRQHMSAAQTAIWHRKKREL